MCSTGEKLKVLCLFLEEDICLNTESMEQDDNLIIEKAKPVGLDPVIQSWSQELGEATQPKVAKYL